MARRMKLTVSLCVFAVSCLTFSEAFRLSINEHLIKSCPGFEEKKRGEGYRCNSEVIDHVHDYAEGFDLAGYDGDMVENYLDMANGGGICYLESETKNKVTLVTVKGDCATMELVCSNIKPKVVDLCSKLKKTLAATTPTPTPTGPTTEAPEQTEGPEPTERPEVQLPAIGRPHAGHVRRPFIDRR